MKKRYFSVFLVLLGFVFQLTAQGQVLESLSIQSKLFGKKMEYSIYLPPGYNASARSYPVLYLLHGYTDDETGWTQYGEIEHIANDMISKGEASPMIIVMPDGGVSWYINNFDRSMPYEDYFFSEFMPYIESTYRIRKEKKFRGVAGLSMGGYGSFLFAIKHPDLFAHCAPLSAAFFEETSTIGSDQGTYDRIFSVLYGKGLKGKDRINSTYTANDPFRIVSDTNQIKKIKTVKYYIDCGDDDFLSPGNAAMHKLLKEKGIPHEYRMRDGVHDWTYWRHSIRDVLGVMSRSFHQ